MVCEIKWTFFTGGLGYFHSVTIRETFIKKSFRKILISASASEFSERMIDVFRLQTILQNLA